MTSLSWTRKYSPKKISEVAGQQLPVEKLKKFIEHKSRKKAALLYGLTGCGKTSSVYALASELGHEVLEINASDVRNAASIKSIVGSAASQLSLFGKGKIILIDEIDGISGKSDRGGVAALAKLIAKSSFPIVMTANDPWNKKFSSLRRAAEMIEFAQLAADTVHSVLLEIVKKEGVIADATALKSLANRCGGDLRAAVNDLQILSATTKKLSQLDVDSLSDRNRIKSMLTALAKILKTTDFDTAAGSFDDITEQPDEWFLWLDENIPSEYKTPQMLARAYESLSQADVFKGRISRSQYWRLLVYIKLFLTAGIASAKDNNLSGFKSYKKSSRLLKIWIANARYQKRKSIAEKIALKTHTSPKKVIHNIHFFKAMIKNNSQIANELGLDEEEVEWLSR